MTIKIIRKGETIIHKVTNERGLVVRQCYVNRETAVALLHAYGWPRRDLGGEAPTYQFIKVVD